MSSEGQLVVPKKQLSLELSKTIDMSNDAVYSAGKHIKKYKRRINDTIDKMEDILEKETDSERKEVELALQKLQTKVAEVKEHKSYKSFEKDLHALESKLNITMEKVFEQYSRCIRKICECYPDQKIRVKQLNEFHEVLGDAFLTKDERKIISLIKSRISQMPTTGQKMLEL
jgi:Fe2+ transport system protein B